MAFPLILIALASISAAVMAYGVHPDWAEHAYGLTIITLSRRLMWPMVFVSLAMCIGLLWLVISGRRRAWWLIGLAPVLALFVHRFAPGSPGPMQVLESPRFVDANSPLAPEAGDWVVGVEFAGKPYAFPYRSLFVTPVVTVTDYDERMLLLWSPYANRATAMEIERGELRGRDLEVVSSPANSLLVYDKRLGQFIVGVTGKRSDGRDVIGAGQRIAAQKMPWAMWKDRRPDTLVLEPTSGGRALAAAPARPILPQYPMRVPSTPDPTTPIALIATTQPAALATDDPTPPRLPINVSIGATRVLLMSDRAGRLRAFDRHARDDLFLTFDLAKPNRKRPEIALTDTDTASLWAADARCIDGPLKDTRLREIDVEDGLYWGVMKYWYPSLELIR